MNQHINIARIRAVSSALEELNDNVVFVGGATVSLYCNRLAEEIRPTDDVDVLIELANYKEYANIEQRLRSKGFVNDVTSSVICRFIINGITVDVMPTSENILGFSNKWYKPGYAAAELYEIGPKCTIKLFSPAYFLASKFEAFAGRGNNDGRTSNDFEDIVYILNNRTSIWEEIGKADVLVKQAILADFSNLLRARHTLEWISAHLERSQKDRAEYIQEKMRICLSV